ncbi:MAG: CBS domain-containing protein [Deltaproteobacteria bacterium]|jgi:tRNA nucleotidyltransferase (CCA-adding enzyme)|nr:CBS domain-containing protein [Deltaproteobacteria bacterium]
MTENSLFAPETIITAHVNADFDALAAMVAAKMLYPEAEIIVPSYREKTGLNYFLDSIAYIFKFRSPKGCDFSKVKTLVLVDTRQRGRVQQVAEALNNPGLQIHCYDHHPDSEDDLPLDYSVIREWGSTTTILTHLIKEKGLLPSPDEATMFGLGIYEDTGSFCYDSTTEHDFAAAAWLRGQFMDLGIISDLMKTALTSEQVLLLNRMIESAVTHEVHGISIVTTSIILENYVDDFAVLTHQIFEMEKNAKVIFALAQMGDRVQVVARSRMPEKINVNMICASLGGGGHSYAAAASVKDKTMEEVREQLLAALFSTIHKEINVGSKMTAPAKVVEDTQSLSEAEAIMLRYGLKAAPVVAAGTMKCIGLIEYQIAARAVGHKLGEQPVSDFMNGRAATMPPDASLYPAMEIILGQRQRMVPVVDAENNVLGVLTRTDIMRLLLDDSIRIPEGDPLVNTQKDRNIAGIIKDKLPKEHHELLRSIGELADKQQVNVYAVGGFVRDLLMDRVNLDIDLTVEGDGIAFARQLAAKLHGRCRSHPMFQTAIVIFKDEAGAEQRIDVATSRLEYYEYPGALPTVELSSIKMDLSRRDFSINALALRLNLAFFGDLVDPFGALRDMREKHIRILHSLSFVEDPTRILRAIRFEKRFNFKIGPQTEKLIKNCLQLGLFQKLSGPRLFHELQRIFNEKEPLLCLQRMEGFGILKQIHPLLALTPSKESMLAEVEDVISWYKLLFLKQQPVTWIVYLLSLCPNVKYNEMSEILDRFLLSAKQRNDFMLLREGTRAASRRLLAWQKDEGRSMGALYRILIKIPLEGILYLMAQNNMKDIKKELSNYLSRLWNMTLDITGEDLLALGVPQGPLVGRIMTAMLGAKADGLANTREEQLERARFILREAEKFESEEKAAREKEAASKEIDSMPEEKTAQ